MDKSPRASKASIEWNNSTLVATFATGDVLSINLNDLPPSIIERLTRHGLEQKVRDSYAGAAPSEAAGLAQKVIEALARGEWTQRAPAGEPRPRGIRLLAQALAEVLTSAGKPVPEDLEARLGELTLSERAKLRVEPKVAAAIARLRPAKGGEDLIASILG